MVKRRVHGDDAGGAYAFGANASPRRLRLESGTIEKPVPPPNRRNQSELVDELMRTLAARHHAGAHEVILQMIALEPEEPFWHQKHGDVLRLLDREHEAAGAYRAAARRYALRGMSAHAGALNRVADMLDDTVPDASRED